MKHHIGGFDSLDGNENFPDEIINSNLGLNSKSISGSVFTSPEFDHNTVQELIKFALLQSQKTNTKPQ